MVDVSKILVAPDISTLREAVATAFEAISVEQMNFERIVELDARIKVVEDKQI